MMKRKCLLLLLLLLVSAPVFSQQDSATAATEPRLVVEAVECRGNKTIPCDFIRRKLHLAASSEVDGDAVQSAQLKLSALPNFESVRVYLEKGSEKGRALLIVEVVEADAFVTELALGVRYADSEAQEDRLTEVIVGRLSNQNLFGKQKIAELALGGSYSSTVSENPPSFYGNYNRQFSTKGFSAAAIYIDPNLFGSNHWFSSLSVAYNRDTWNFNHSSVNFYAYDPIYAPGGGSVLIAGRQEGTTQQTDLGLSIGYRLWEYSYLFGRFGYSERRNQGSGYAIQISDSLQVGTYASQGNYQSYENQWLVGYGWDSEDDAYFPTRGWRFSATLSDCDRCYDWDWRLAYKQTWMMGSRSVWTLNVGGEPEAAGDRLRPIQPQGGNSAFERSTDAFYYGGLGVTYAHLLSASDALGGVRRGRWYVKLAAGPADISGDGFEYEGTGDYIDQAHVTLGLRFESKVLGVVDLFATGSYFWPQPFNSNTRPPLP